MKKINYNKIRLFLCSLIICLAFSVPAWSLSMTHTYDADTDAYTLITTPVEVGIVDSLINTSTSPENSGDEAIIVWLTNELGVEFGNLGIKYEPLNDDDWLTDMADNWAFKFNENNEPGYFFIKTGETGDERTLLFENKDSKNYAVLDLKALGIEGNILKISHITEVNPVPEPATMALFGLGLIGIAGIGRKTRKN